MSQPGRYPFDPEVRAAMEAAGIPIPSPPVPPPLPPPGPGGAMPAARLGDTTMHFGVITPVVTGLKVLITGQPAATMGDPHVCPLFDGPKPHLGGLITKGSTKVLICGKPAARVGDLTRCVGAPGAIGPPGAVTVLIGG
jgi:uncharacterized Zn-binding protein involved in type VI secretion